VTHLFRLGYTRRQGSLLSSATRFLLRFAPGLSLLLQSKLRRHGLLEQVRDRGMSVWNASVPSACTGPAQVVASVSAKRVGFSWRDSPAEAASQHVLEQPRKHVREP